MRFIKIIILFASVSVLSSCSNSPEPIVWGKDMCAHCKMSAIDQKFGAEIFTQKGKTYKFDAAECMLAYINNNNVKQEDVAQYLVADAAKPGTLTEAKNATYLISEKMPSPMGGNLSAYANSADAENQRIKSGGETHNWQNIITIFSKR